MFPYSFFFHKHLIKNTTQISLICCNVFDTLLIDLFAYNITNMKLIFNLCCLFYKRANIFIS